MPVNAIFPPHLFLCIIRFRYIPVIEHLLVNIFRRFFSSGENNWLDTVLWIRILLLSGKQLRLLRQTILIKFFTRSSVGMVSSRKFHFIFSSEIVWIDQWQEYGHMFHNFRQLTEKWVIYISNHKKHLDTKSLKICNN